MQRLQMTCGTLLLLLICPQLVRAQVPGGVSGGTGTTSGNSVGGAGTTPNAPGKPGPGAPSGGTGGGGTSLNTPTPVLTIASPQLTVAGVQEEVVKRTVTFYATGTVAQSATIIKTDLLSADKAGVFPVSAITVDKNTLVQSVPGQNPQDPGKKNDDNIQNKFSSVPVNFDLSAVPAGQYDGQLWLSYGSSPIALPVSISVKHPWWKPVPLLILAILASFLLAAYRSKWQPRDQIIAALGQLQAEMTADKALWPGGNGALGVGRAFEQSIRRNMMAATFSLQSGQGDAASRALTAAQLLWAKWQEFRDGWIEQLGALDVLRSQVVTALGTPGAAGPAALQIIKNKLDDAQDNGPQMDQPSQLRDVVQALGRQFNQLQALDVRIQMLSVKAQGLTNPGDQATCQPQARQIREDFNALNPGSTTFPQDYSALEGRVSSAETAIAPLPTNVPAGAPMMPLMYAATPPLKITGPTAKEVKVARRRLDAFGVCGYLRALILVTSVGYATLYAANKTFGSALDYLGMFAWAFGSETLTRASLSGFLSGLNLPGVTGLLAPVNPAPK